MKTKLPLVFLLSALAVSPLCAGPTLEVKNTEGRALMIELVALEAENVVFVTVADKGKERSLPIAKFDADSQEKIRAEAKDLPARVPKLDMDVTITKKREKDGYYMIEQTVSGKVKLRNLSTQIVFPKSKGYLVYFGRDRRTPDKYKVMSKRTFDVEVPANQFFEKELLGFKTRFDSDNKGAGNLGGYEYDSYLLVITDDAGAVLATKTTDGGIQTAIGKDLSKAKRLADLADNAILTMELEPMDGKME